MLAAWKEAGIEPPAEFLEPELDPPPELTVLDWMYLSMYREIATCRALAPNGHPLPVPFTAIDSVARRFEVFGIEFMTLLSVVRELDAFVIDEIQKEAEKEKSNAGRSRRS